MQPYLANKPRLIIQAESGPFTGINGLSILERRNSYPITAFSFFAYQTKIFDILRTLPMFFYMHEQADGID